MLDFWILWNNARNLHYIKKRNPRKGIRLADNKLQTKQFLWERGIPFAETYAKLSTRKQLADFDFQQLQGRPFVIKPNHGSKGKGILIPKLISLPQQEKNPADEKPFWKRPINSFFRKKKTESSSAFWFELQGKFFSEGDLRRAMVDILDGKHSLTVTDEIIIEEKLVPGAGFQEFCEFWLADLRIIVFNLVPVAAMIRVPTEKSGGKANLNAGGVGCGIDIGSGKIISMLYKGKIFSDKFPAEFASYQGKQIPFWNDILFHSSKVQYFVNLGYLALDRVITNEGPKLLEINARAGLEVQKVADIRLKRVLEKLNDMKIHDPEKGVAIAKTLFSREENLNLKQAKILYLSQKGKIKFIAENAQEEYDLQVNIDLQQQKNQLSPDLAKRCEELKAKALLEIPESEISIKNLKYEVWSWESTLILGQKTASRFLIKPLKKEAETINILNPKKVVAMELAQLHLIDNKLERLSKRLNLTARLRPVNYFNELDRFISEKGNYNPTFEYRFPELWLQEKWQDELNSFQDQLKKSYLKSPFLQLFKEKCEELQHRARLLKAYTQQDFAMIEKENIALFGDFDSELLALAKEKVFQASSVYEPERILTSPEIREFCEKYLTERGIFWVDIVENSASFSRMSISMGKTCKLNISPKIQLNKSQLQALLAHEVDIHLMRYLNGQKSGRNIFKSGTAYYLKDEEGLAVWSAMKVLPEGEENLAIYKKYYLLAECGHYDFQSMKNLVYVLYPNRSLEGIFKTILRVKKGQIFTSNITQTSIRMKDKVYLDGYEKIRKLNPDTKLLETLKKGKIKVEDQIFIIT